MSTLNRASFLHDSWASHSLVGYADGEHLEDERALREFKRNHRKMRRNWDLPSKFPDVRVIDAYRKVCHSALCLLHADR